MKTLPFRTPAERASALPEVIAHLRADGLLAYPTETVYGFGCLLRGGALRKLAALKGGRESKQFLLLLPDAAQADQLAWNEDSRVLARCFWPGALTLVLNAPAGGYPADVVRPGGGIAVRVSPHAGVQELLAALREPLTSTSANVPGSPPGTDAVQVAGILSTLAGSGTLILDGGSLVSSASSTIVDCTVSPPKVLRSGVIPDADIERCLHELRA